MGYICHIRLHMRKHCPMKGQVQNTLFSPLNTSMNHQSLKEEIYTTMNLTQGQWEKHKWKRLTDIPLERDPDKCTCKNVVVSELCT